MDRLRPHEITTRAALALMTVIAPALMARSVRGQEGQITSTSDIGRAVAAGDMSLYYGPGYDDNGRSLSKETPTIDPNCVSTSEAIRARCTEGIDPYYEAIVTPAMTITVSARPTVNPEDCTSTSDILRERCLGGSSK